MKKRTTGELIRIYLYKFFNFLSATLYYGLRVISVVAWLFVVNNIVSAVFGNIWYKLAGSGSFVGKIILWILNNIYVKSESFQYMLLFISAKAVWIALLASFGIRFGIWFYNKTRIWEYRYYVRKGWLNPQTNVIVQNNMQSNDAVEIANMRAEIAEQKLEIERLKNMNNVSNNLSQEVSSNTGSCENNNALEVHVS